jgi:hypothetical protein
LGNPDTINYHKRVVSIFYDIDFGHSALVGMYKAFRIFSKEAIHASAQTRERIPSNAWARKIAAPTKPITAVIVSNIANVLYATGRQKTAATLHSQKDFRAPTHKPDRSRILRNRCYRSQYRGVKSQILGAGSQDDGTAVRLEIRPFP